jgi:hypothetical protein
MTASMLLYLPWLEAFHASDAAHFLSMELPKLKDCGDDIVRAAKDKILAPQKLAKDCLSDVGLPPFLTNTRGC